MDKLQRILAIETSSPRLSLALGTEHQVLKTYQGPLQWRHAESMFDGMKQLLAQARWPVQSLTGVVVSIGPGSFTGIRIGLAAARALSQALKIPLAGVSTLKSLAAGQLKPGTQACAMIDALRGEVFTALYGMDRKGRVKTIWKEQRLPFPELAGKLKSLRPVQLCLTGDATPLYKEDLRRIQSASWQFVTLAQGYPRAEDLLKLGTPQLLKRRASLYEQIIPMYLRSAAAVERRRASPNRQAAVKRRKT